MDEMEGKNSTLVSIIGDQVDEKKRKKYLV